MATKKYTKLLMFVLMGCCLLSFAFIMIRFAMLYHHTLIKEQRLYYAVKVGTKLSIKKEENPATKAIVLVQREPTPTVSETVVSLRTTATLMNITTSTKPRLVTKDPKNCSAEQQKLVGVLHVDSQVPENESVIVVSNVLKGGAFTPKICKAVQRVAIIIPYRKRPEQLKIFVRHMHPMLQRQLLDYRIIVVEQAGETPFNRAMLFNIGYKEALKFQNFTCFVFHDVDLIPENDGNYYGCPTSPRHLSVAIDKFKYRLPYKAIFGGAGCLTRHHFEMINGFSNKFWGWGGEDDDLYTRIQARNLKLTRPSMEIGRYKMIRIFHKSAEPDPQRTMKLKTSAKRMARDGLNSLKYNVEKIEERTLYTLITVAVNPNDV